MRVPTGVTTSVALLSWGVLASCVVDAFCPLARSNDARHYKYKLSCPRLTHTEKSTNMDALVESSSSSSPSSSSSAVQQRKEQQDNDDDDDEQGPLLVRVQRAYQTFPWLYKNDTTTYKINYRVEGPSTGPPILLIHGFGANVNHYRFQFPALAEAGYRVYAIDLLGFGASDKPSNVPYSMELFATIIKDFVETLEPDRPWFLAGNSIGGLCSLAVAAALPTRRVQGVVLFNCSGGMTGFRYDDVPYYIRPILYLVQNVLLNPAMGGKSFFAKFKTRQNIEFILKQQGVYADTTHVDEELLEILLGPADDKGAEDVFLKVIAGPPGPTPESLLPHIKCPILAQWGNADPWTPLKGGAHPATQFPLYYKGPSWTLDVLENTGHCPHDEQPERVHKVLLPWLQQTLDSYTPALYEEDESS